MEANEKKFLVWCITKEGKEFTVGNGSAMTEKQADHFAEAHRGGISSQVGHLYSVRHVNYKPFPKVLNNLKQPQPKTERRP